jgi:AsmA protein
MRWLLRIFLMLLVLAVVLVAGLFLVPSDQIARIAAAQFEQATGRKLTISGKISPSLWPQIGARVEKISVANADWSKAGPMLEADVLSVGLDLSALIGGEIKIRKVEVTAPVIRLERATDGRVNWDFTQSAGNAAPTQTSSTATAQGGAGGGLGTITLDKGTIKGGTLTFTDHANGAAQTLTAMDATVALPSVGGPADVDFAAIMNSAPVTATGRIESLNTLLDGGVVPVSLEVGVGKSTVQFSGDAGISPPVAKGHLVADLSDTVAIASLAGVTAPDLPEGFGRNKTAIEGDVTWTADRSFHLRAGAITLDANTLSGDLDLTTAGERPKLTAKLKSDSLMTFPPGGAGKAAPGAASGVAPTAAVSGWSAAPIDVSGLAAADAAITLNAASLKVGGITLGPLQMTLSNDRARAVVDIAKLAAYGGSVTGQFVVNGRGGLSVGGDLRASGLAMQPLLQDAAGYDRLIGTGELSAKFLGAGNSLAAIMSGLSGQGQFAFTDGALVGLDLVGMLRSLDVGYVGAGQKTIFDKITGTYVIDGGVLRNDDLALAGPLISATGRGSVGIGTRTIDYKVVPSALAKSDGSGGVKVPLLIKGTWGDPKFKLDLEALAKEKLGLDEAALKAKLAAERRQAEDQAKAKAAEALGVAPVQGESLEDAAKRKLQEEALKGLGKLFGGN